MDERHRQERPTGRETRQGERRGQVIPFQPRTRQTVVTSYGGAWYHQAAIDEAAKPVPPVR